MSCAGADIAGEGCAELGYVLITGGGGFIGRNLGHRLVGQNRPIRSVDSLVVAPQGPVPGDLQVRDVRSLTPDDLAAVSTVVHLAARKNVPESFRKSNNLVHNVEVDHHLIRTFVASAARRLVVASSCEVYGAQPHPLHEGHGTKPLSPYAAGKCTTEALVSLYRRLHPEKEFGVVRLFNVYGPDEGIDAVVPAFISSLLDAGVCRVEGDGSQERDLSHIDDVAHMLQLVIDSPTLPEVINIGSGRSTAVLDVARELIKIAGHGRVVHTAPRPNEIDRFVADTTRFEKICGPLPRRSLAVGLRGAFAARLEQTHSRRPAERSAPGTPAMPGERIVLRSGEAVVGGEHQ